MADMFHTGRVVDLILVMVLLECVALAWWRSRGAAVDMAALLPTLLSGAALLLTLRLALSGARWEWLALSLLGALLAHLTDLAGRLRAPLR
jgi:hypothetical protein